MSRPHPDKADDPRLEHALERAWGDSAETGAAPRAKTAIGDALRTFRVQRRRRVALVCSACLLLAVGGLWIATRDDGAPNGIETADAVAYGKDLHRRVMHDVLSPADDDREYLKNNAEARAEYLAALDHESSFVRRVALDTLTFSGIEIPAKTLTRLLTEHREDLEKPLAVAAVGDSGRLIGEALERRRMATIRRTLSSAFIMAAQGNESIEAEIVANFIDHEDSSVRSNALSALSRMRGFKPTPRIWEILKTDPHVFARISAANIIQRNGGPDADRQLLAYLSVAQDPTMERILLTMLREVEGVEDVALTRWEAERGSQDAETEVAYLRALHRRGLSKPARSRLPALIRTANGPGFTMAVALVTEVDLRELRSVMVAQRDRVGQNERRSIAVHLMAWSTKAQDPAQIIDAIGVLAQDGRRSDARLLEPLKEHPNKRVREAASAAARTLRGS